MAGPEGERIYVIPFRSLIRVNYDEWNVHVLRTIYLQLGDTCVDDSETESDTTVRLGVCV